MNILMIGHSQSGKTSYMAGLYKLYGDKAEGFGLWLSDSDKRSKLQKMASNLSKGIYPSGTDIAAEYNFWLQFENSLLIPFNWYDYRGGSLSEVSSWSRDKENLLKRIDAADALIVFIDGQKAMHEVDENLEDEYETLMWTIQKSLSKKSSTKGQYFPISFVFTKGDLYLSHSHLYNTPAFDYFMPFFKTINNGDAAVGEIVVAEVTKNGVYNVYMPLIFSLGYGMHKYISERIFSINYEVQRYEDAGWLQKAFDYGDAKSAREKALSEYKNLKTLESLSDYIDKQIKEWADNDYILRF